MLKITLKKFIAIVEIIFFDIQFLDVFIKFFKYIERLNVIKLDLKSTNAFLNNSIIYTYFIYYF